MPSTRTTRLLAPSFLAPAIAVTLLAAGALSGCGGSSGGSAGPGPGTPTASSTPTPSPTPSPSASASSSPSSPATSATPSPSATTTRGASAALLSAAELPRLDSATPWSQGSTGPAGSNAFGLCQKFDLLTIGAESAVQRSFTAGSATTAGQQVADFPDAQNTVRAGTVLEAWHRDCAGRVRGTGVQVGPITSATTARGRAWWYAVRYSSGGVGHRSELGVVIEGARMTVLTSDTTTVQTYPSGRDPMQLTVQAAAAKLV